MSSLFKNIYGARYCASIIVVFPGKLKNKSNVNSIILVVYIGFFIEISFYKIIGKAFWKILIFQWGVLFLILRNIDFTVVEP